MAVTVDYRDVVSEVLIKRQQNRFLGYIFPDYTDYTPLGFINGTELAPVYDFDYDGIFSSGFEWDIKFQFNLKPIQPNQLQIALRVFKIFVVHLESSV